MPARRRPSTHRLKSSAAASRRAVGKDRATTDLYIRQIQAKDCCCLFPGGAMAFLRATTALWALTAALYSQPSASQENPQERGRYLVETVAFCGVCHNT